MYERYLAGALVVELVLEMESAKVLVQEFGRVVDEVVKALVGPVLAAVLVGPVVGWMGAPSPNLVLMGVSSWDQRRKLATKQLQR